MAYFRFFLAHPRVLSFGVLLTLFSSFGQTFLISMFVPRLLEEFALNTAQFGVLYAGATLTSAASLPFFGRLIDRITLRLFSLAVGSGLVASCFVMALAPNVVVLFIAILGLRLTGQGLLSLTASTTMARVFTEGRGKALSLSGLGYCQSADDGALGGGLWRRNTRCDQRHGRHVRHFCHSARPPVAVKATAKASACCPSENGRTRARRPGLH